MNLLWTYIYITITEAWAIIELPSPEHWTTSSQIRHSN